MIEITTCINCDRKLRLPQGLIGKTVRCPGCRLTFVARPDDGIQQEAPLSRTAARNDGFAERRAAREEDSYPLAPSRDDNRPSRRDDYDDRPRRRDRDDDYDRRPRRPTVAKGWRGTRLGLFLVIISNWLFLAVIGIGILGFGIALLVGASLLSTASQGFNPESSGRFAAGAAGAAIGWILFIVLLALMMFASTILQLVGQGLCMMVPNLRGTALRGLAIAAFALSCAAFLFNTGSAASRQSSVGGLSGLLSTAAFVCWIIFLRLIASELRQPDLAGRLMSFLITAFVYGGVAVLLFIIAVCGGALAVMQARSAEAVGATAIVLLVLMALVGLGGVAILVWYIFLMQQVRGVIDRHLARL
jgi:hypothetical protein